MRKGEETRAAVLDSAVALASEVGLAQVTIGRLADRVKLSKSGLFAHFGSKEDLQVEILREAARRFVSLVVAPALQQPRGEPRVRALFEGWLEWAKADFLPGGCIFMAAAVELDDQSGPPRAELVATEKDWLDTIATAARIAVAEKHFRRDLDPRQLAHELVSLVHGHHFFRRLMKDPQAEARTRRAFERLITDARAA